MLVNITLNDFDKGMAEAGYVTTNPETGVYVITGFNFNYHITEPFEENIKKYSHLKNKFEIYGVCDNFEQVKHKYRKMLNAKTKNYCISFTPIRKSQEPSDGGWRWHKWGTYIGKQKPTTEYIYDEKDIELVYCFQIYQILGSVQPELTNNDI